MLARIRLALSSLFNHLNLLGSIVLAYALANPSASAELIALLPPAIRPYAPLLALVWFALVQLAKARAIAKAKAA